VPKIVMKNLALTEVIATFADADEELGCVKSSIIASELSIQGYNLR